MHIAIITEYNPFHMGHEYQIAEVKKAFPDATVTAIMGGIFSQRGEPYITTPYVRAEAAVLCGADLCIELPFPFSSAPARIFARAGVSIAEKIGADMLAFGSECGDIEMLSDVLLRLESDEMQEALARFDDGSISKMRAYSLAYKELYGSDAPDLPNDILGIEYLRAIKTLGAKITPYTVKRKGNYKGGSDGFKSASEMRLAYEKDGFEKGADGVPKDALEVYRKADKNGLFGTNYEKLASAVMLEFTRDNGDIAFSGGGLYNHLQRKAATTDKIADLILAASRSRYTLSEISRCILYTLLQVRSADLEEEVLYTRLFAANARGREIVNKISGIEIITKPSATDKLSAAARAQYEKTFFAERAFALTLGKKYEFTKQIPRIK